MPWQEQVTGHQGASALQCDASCSTEWDKDPILCPPPVLPLRLTGRGLTHLTGRTSTVNEGGPAPGTSASHSWYQASLLSTGDTADTSRCHVLSLKALKPRHSLPSFTENANRSPRLPFLHVSGEVHDRQALGLCWPLVRSSLPLQVLGCGRWAHVLSNL